MRLLYEVIEKIQVVNQDEALNKALESMQTSALYAPPEFQGVWWNRAAEVLHDHLGDEPGEEWYEVLEIWNPGCTKQRHDTPAISPNDEPAG